MIRLQKKEALNQGNHEEARKQFHRLSVLLVYVPLVVAVLLFLPSQSHALADTVSGWTSSSYVWPGLNVGAQCSPGGTLYYWHTTTDEGSYQRTEQRKHVCDLGQRFYRYFYDYPDDGFVVLQSYPLNPDGTPDITPPEPEYCSNLVRDEDELGIDCGGSCTFDCSLICPEGYEADESLGIGICKDASVFAVVMSGAECPIGYARQSDGICVKVTFGIDGAPETTPAPDVPYYTVAFDEETPTLEKSVTSEVTDNMDGTSTEVQVDVTLTQSPDGNTIKTTTTNEYHIDNSTGEKTLLTSSVTESNGNNVDTGVPADLPLPVGMTGLYNSVGINMTPFHELSDTVKSRFPLSLLVTFSHLFDSWVMTPVAPSWSFSFPNPFGSSVNFTIDLEPMNSIADKIRWVMRVFFIVAFFLVVYRRWS